MNAKTKAKDVAILGGDPPVKGPPPADAQDGIPLVIEPPVPNTCGNCLAWVTPRDSGLPFYGGCAKSGQETVHYGDIKFRLYTPNSMPGCRAWQGR